MGREWNWSGRSSRKRGGFCREDEEEAAKAAYSSSCFSSIFHFFDFHPTQYALNHHRRPSFPDYDSTLPTGVEAPRNSLDLEELPSPWISADKGSLQIPMGMKIKTRGSDASTKNSKAGGLNNDYFADNSNINSPSAKTPNLVARLMGLDVLPETSSPSSSSSSATFSNRLSKSHLNRLSHRCKYQEKLHGTPRVFLDSENIQSSRSLPETPRVSLARKSNVDYHHRLSLQDEDHQVEILSRFKRKDVLMMNDENRSPNEYAQQILRQVKENVSRKAGFDITNTIKNGNFSQKVGCKRNPEEKFRFTEFKNSKEQTSKVAVKQKPKPKTRESHKNAEKVNDHKKFSSRKKKTQITEPCVRPSKAAKAINKHCRKTPLSNNLLSFSDIVVVPTLILPIRTDLHSSTKRPPKKQIANVQESKHESQLSGSSSQMYRQKPTEGNDKKDIEICSKPETNSTSTTNNGRSELEYVSRILSRTFFSKDIKGHVENSTAISGCGNGEPLSYSDRKLLSDLTDELLRESFRNEENFRKNDGLKIITTILQRIKSFPRAKCEVLEDLDRLIEGDLGNSKLERGLKMAREEGGEEIVREIEKEIMEKLVHEATTAMAFFF